ncbi:hypothetical protein LTR85_000309 [Meristemomyces frigidus]|nr:hypothetical protein LTR85_000309 [Meristemomyces frigidus]
MAPRIPEDTIDDGPEGSSDEAFDAGLNEGAGEEAESHTEESDVSEAEAAPDGLEEEYHTEESSDEGADEDAPLRAAPYLPAHLLDPLPSPAQSAEQAVSIPWAQMTRSQKQAERSRRKRAYEKLRRDTTGSGVLQAGKAAQVKRGVVPGKDRVKSGRVGKKSKVQVSGRQQLLEERKRMVERGRSELARPTKTPKTKSKR